MSYKISSYTKAKARQLNVTVAQSKVKGKKIDVFKDGKKVASVGALGMNDYPTYLSKEKEGLVPKGTAARRRALYKQRHESDRHKRNSPGFYADNLLW
jgi:hypothetical protein